MCENPLTIRENRMVAEVAFFSVLAWLTLIPAFYFRNIWLLPLHEVISWVEQQVELFGRLGITLDPNTFRQSTYLLSQYSPCISLASLAFSIAIGVNISQTLRSLQDNSSKRQTVLRTALVVSILGLLTTLLVFGVSLFYLLLNIVYIG